MISLARSKVNWARKAVSHTSAKKKDPHLLWNKRLYEKKLPIDMDGVLVHGERAPIPAQTSSFSVCGHVA